MRSALDEEDSRQEWFEATLRVLDENPEYVDEFYLRARKHPKTLERFVANTARGLKQEDLAKMTARHLTRNPESLRQVLVQTLRESASSEPARRAIASAITQEHEHAARVSRENPEMIRQSMVDTLEAANDSKPVQRAIIQAMAEKTEAATDVITEEPELVHATLLATVSHVLQKPEARRAFIRALHTISPEMARLLANNPKLLTQRTSELVEQLRAHPVLLEHLAQTLASEIAN